MTELFEILGWGGLDPLLQTLLFALLLVFVVGIVIEVMFWASWSARVKRVRLDEAKAPRREVRPAFFGEDEAKRDEQLARGDAYEGPDLGPAAAMREQQRSRLGWLRRLFLWVILPLLGATGAWLLFGDPLADTDIGEAREWSGLWDVFRALWYFLVMTAGKISLIFLERKVSREG